MATKKLTYLEVPNSTDKYEFNASYIDGKTPDQFFRESLTKYDSIIYTAKGTEYDYNNVITGYYAQSSTQVSNDVWSSRSKGFVYLGEYLTPDELVGSKITYITNGQDVGLTTEWTRYSYSTDIIQENEIISNQFDNSTGVYIYSIGGYPCLFCIPSAGSYSFGGENEFYLKGTFTKPGLWVLTWNLLQFNSETTEPLIPVITSLQLNINSSQLQSPTTYYASTPETGSDYSFATVFDNDYLQKLTGKLYNPKDGDALMVPEMNAIYKYIIPTSGNVRVYIYQPFRDNINVANSQFVAELIGNWALGEDNVRPTGNLYNYRGSAASTDPTSNWTGMTRWDSGIPVFSTYAGIPGDSTKKTPLLFKDSAFRLAADFTLTWSSGQSISNLIKNYLTANADKYPYLSRNSDGGVVDGTIFVIECDQVSFDNRYTWLCSAKIDNALAVEAYSKSRKKRSILFELWHGDCWYEGGSDTSFNYLISPLNSNLIDYNAKDYTVTLYWSEEWGGEDFELKATMQSAQPLPGNLPYYNVNYEFRDVLGRLSNYTGKTGYWVYDKPISQEAFRTKIEFSPDSINSFTDNNGNTYTTQILDQYAKVGDIHGKTPSSILSLGGTSVWRCDGCYFGKNRQRWKKIF